MGLEAVSNSQKWPGVNRYSFLIDWFKSHSHTILVVVFKNTNSNSNKQMIKVSGPSRYIFPREAVTSLSNSSKIINKARIISSIVIVASIHTNLQMNLYLKKPTAVRSSSIATLLPVLILARTNNHKKHKAYFLLSLLCFTKGDSYQNWTCMHVCIACAYYCLS
jgi:hypothetical protein